MQIFLGTSVERDNADTACACQSRSLTSGVAADWRLRRAAFLTVDLVVARFELERLVAVAIIESLDRLHLCILGVRHRVGGGWSGFWRAGAASGDRSVSSRGERVFASLSCPSSLPVAVSSPSVLSVVSAGRCVQQYLLSALLCAQEKGASLPLCANNKDGSEPDTQVQHEHTAQHKHTRDPLMHCPGCAACGRDRCSRGAIRPLAQLSLSSRHADEAAQPARDQRAARAARSSATRAAVPVQHRQCECSTVGSLARRSLPLPFPSEQADSVCAS